MDEANLYNYVKNLFQPPKEAIKIYQILKNRMLYETGDVLYIFKNKKEAKEMFWRTVATTPGITYNTEKLKIDFYSYAEYYKSIKQCEKILDGYRFKEIEFIESDKKQCEYCQSSYKIINSKIIVSINNIKGTMQVIENHYGTFGALIGEVPIEYCPNCGKRLGGKYE